MTPKQRDRQRREHRESGRYAKVNPCYRCGKSAGVDYSSYNADATDAMGNAWHDIALCLCHPCAKYLWDLDDPAAAWADVTAKGYGNHPQGKATP